MSYWTILDVRHLERSCDWDALFGRKAPLIAEIGFGRGDHLVHLGKKHPEANIVGVEVSQPSLRKASSKVKNNRLDNVRVVDGSGPQLLWMNVEPDAISQLHINFPDPWHREGHQRRRLINPTFLHLAATRIIPGGLLYVATDHPSYQPVVTECLEQSPHFDSRLDSTYTLDSNDRFQTKYELKALREGRVPFYYKFVRNQVIADNCFQIPEELPMPHAIVQMPLSLREIRDKFAPFEVEQEGIHVHFKGVFESAERPTLLVETYIHQQPQDQRLGIVINERVAGEYILKLHDIGFPRRTDGAHLAVAQLTRWLVSQHNDSRIVNHTLQNFKPQLTP